MIDPQYKLLTPFTPRTWRLWEYAVSMPRSVLEPPCQSSDFADGASRCFLSRACSLNASTAAHAFAGRSCRCCSRMPAQQENTNTRAV
jgi:hypothetical protein